MEPNQSERRNTAPKVNISPDGLSAKITLPSPAPGEMPERYPVPVLMDILKNAGVVFGIDRDALTKLSDFPMYDREFLVATGNPPTDGKPGEFEYLVDLTVNTKPTIRPDGSTDYMNIKTIETVRAGDEIIKYHPAVQGAKGMTVRGQTIEPKPVRDLPPINGRGFTRSPDNLTYISSIDGKIEQSGNRIIITNVHEVNGNADISSGNIEFNGDVIIHGGARDGVIIKASGNVTIEGVVEGCEIHAGRDLFLLSGVKGGDKTLINAKGNISAQFIEYAIVNCDGNIIADYIFKCRVTCEGRVELTGNKSAIIGGAISAVQGVTSDEIGNDFGAMTIINVGVDQERALALVNMSKKIEALNLNIEKIKVGLETFEKLGAERGMDYKDDPRRIQLLRVKIRDEAVVLEEKAKLEKMKSVVEKGAHATVRVNKKVYAGVTVSIDNNRVFVNDSQQRVEFVKTPTGVRMEAM